MIKTLASICLAMCLLTPLAAGASFSFTGDFGKDDDVQIFNFAVATNSSVTLRSYSYAGGVNAAGQTIQRGGFDPILALFDATGALIDHQDDAPCGAVPADTVTDSCFDVNLTVELGPGSYQVSVMQYDNFPVGPSLSDGFTRQGQSTFANSFMDVNEDQRDSHWAFDILNVAEATQVPMDAVPEPSTMVLAGAGLAALTIGRLRR